MQTRTLEAVLAVADELHFGRAAARLGVPQPSVSQRIQRLERELGIQIFERDRRGVHVTPVGMEIISRARSVVAGAKWIEQFARDARHGFGGEITIAAVGSAFFKALPSILEPLGRELPRLNIRVKELETDALLDELALGTIDLGFARPPFPSEFLHFRVWDEPLVVAVNDKNPLSQLKSLSVADLTTQRLVFFPRETGPGYWDRVNALFLGEGTGFQPDSISEHVTTMLGLVALNDGVSIVPQSASLPYPNVRYIQLLPETRLPLDVVAAAQHQSQSVTAVLEVISRLQQSP